MKLLSPLLLICSALSASFTPIEDLSDLPLLSSEFSQRKTAKIRLQNGIEMLLISDERADKSAATVAVRSGSWNDPDEYAGMAHFCEHMLFMGTEKYPDTNEFFTQISNYDGQTNAFTAPDRTVYMFSSRTEGFLPLLDRFAHFFIDPIFDPSNIAREMHAVDQEFALQKENDGWRKYMVFKETANPDHPIRSFSTGNSQTLAKIPQSALKAWHEKCYGADRIRVAIYSPLPLETLQEAAVAAFQDVPERDPLPKAERRQFLTSADQRGRLTAIHPIQNRKTLSLSWELPFDLTHDDSKSAELVAYALGRGQKHSLYETLKAQGWIDGLNVSVDDIGGNDHLFFEVDLELSKKGNEQINQIIETVFQAIAGLKQSGVPESLFVEKNQIAQLKYQYMRRVDAFDYIASIGRTISDEDLSTYPRRELLASKYAPQKVTETLSFLTPDQCCISYLAPSNESFEKKEKWLNVPYTIRPIAAEQLRCWTAATPHPAIRIADPNHFVPKNLAILPALDPQQTPACIAQTPFGKAYYIRSSEFQTPEAAIHLHIYSPEMDGSAKSAVLASLYLDHLTDQITPLLMNANSAGLRPDIHYEKNHIHIEITGFSEKAPLLLNEILREMPLHPPTSAQFALYYDRHEKDYMNGSKELAAKQARELLVSLIGSDKMTKKDKLAALAKIEFADFQNFHKKLFEKTYLNALFAGNLSIKTAEASWLDVLHVLGKNPYPAADHPSIKALHLPEQQGPFVLTQEVEVQGNAALLLIDEGDFTFERRAAQEILASALKEAFFDTLRTKQKTGYIATSQEIEYERRLYQYFLVQSNSHQPEDLLHRFELFLEDYRQDFADNLPQDRFELLRASAIASLKTRYRNIQDKSALWDRLAFEEEGDFAFLEKRIEGLSNLKFEEFQQVADAFLSRSNRKRLALLFEGKLASPFSYTPTTASQLAEKADYVSRH